MKMKGCVQWNLVCGWEDFASSRDRTQTARSVGQRLTQWATGAPQLTEEWYDDKSIYRKKVNLQLKLTMTMTDKHSYSLTNSYTL